MGSDAYMKNASKTSFLKRQLVKLSFFVILLICFCLLVIKFADSFNGKAHREIELNNVDTQNETVKKANNKQLLTIPQSLPLSKLNSHTNNSNFCEEYTEHLLSSDIPHLIIFPHSQTFNTLLQNGTKSNNEYAEGVVQPSEYKYFKLCISNHNHYHRIIITLHIQPLPLPSSSSRDLNKGLLGEADLYISTTNQHPTITTSTWLSKKKGNDQISLPTYTEDYLTSKSNTIYIGVYAPDQGGNWGSGVGAGGATSFKLDVGVVDVSGKEVLGRGNLRGKAGRIMEGQNFDVGLLKKKKGDEDNGVDGKGNIV